MRILLFSFFLLASPLCHAQTVGEYLRDGNDAFEHDRYDQAIFNYTKAIEINPNYAKAYDNRGAAYAKEGSLQRAADDFTMAIAADPNDLPAYTNRRLAYFQLKEYDKAWADVFRIEALGGTVDRDFYQSLSKVSRR